MICPFLTIAQSQKDLKSILRTLEHIKYVPEGFSSIDQPSYKEHRSIYDFEFSGADSTIYLPVPSSHSKFSEDSVPAFYIDIFEVTREEYFQSISQVGPDKKTPLRIDTLSFSKNPVTHISWFEAKDYAKYKEALINKNIAEAGLDTNQYWIKCDLPSKDEWEKSATIIYDNTYYPKFRQEVTYYTQPSTASPFYNNQPIGNFIVPDSNYQMVISDVGSYRQTERGLFDLSGNVSEWTRDTTSEKLIFDSFQKHYLKVLGDEENTRYYPASVVRYYDGKFHNELKKLYPDWSIFDIESQNTDSMFIFPANNNPSEMREIKKILSYLKFVKTLEQRNIESARRCNRPTIVKGGAYNKHFKYAQNAVSQLFDSNESFDNIGFRLTYKISLPLEEALNKLLFKTGVK